MKKAIAILLVTLFVVAAFAACAKNVVGTYKNDEGVEIKLDKGGKGTMGMMGITVDITYKVSGNKVKLTYEGATEELTIKDGNLVDKDGNVWKKQ